MNCRPFIIGEIERLAIFVKPADFTFGLRDPDDEVYLATATAGLVAMLMAQILRPGSKLATARGLHADTARDSLASTLGLAAVNEDDLYAAMDRLLLRQQRFGLSRVVLVGDRGMLTEARIRKELKPATGVDWISALRGPAIRSLVQSGAVQMSLFDERDLIEVRSEAYPGERLMVCRNSLLAAESGRIMFPVATH